MYLNHVQLMASSERPEKRQVRGNGDTFTVLSVATQQSWKDANDEWQSKTEWHRVVAFNRLATALADTLHKGDTFLSMECSSVRNTSAGTARARRPRPRRSRSGACARIPCAG